MRETEPSASPGPARIKKAVIASFDELVGAHVDALSDFYGGAPPADPEDLGERPRGTLLGVVSTGDAHLVLRPIVKLVSRNLMPWEGVVFDHGGNAGANVVLGRHVQRFKASLGPSKLDGQPTLVLSYAALRWPVSALTDELRSVGAGRALGCTFFGRSAIAWFGLERRQDAR